MSRPIFALLLLITAPLACQPAGEQTTMEETASDTTGVTSIDPAQAEETIRDLTAQFAAAATQGDTLALGEMYAEEAVLMPPGGETTRGREAIRGAWSSFLSEMSPTMELRTEEVRVADSGELAYEIGGYTLAGQGPDGASTQDIGKYVAVWHNDGEQWRIVADIWNSNAPPPAQ